MNTDRDTSFWPSAFCLMAAILLTTTPARAGQKTASAGWQLRQRHKLYGRRVELLLTRKAFKWSCADSGVSVLMKAPAWAVIAFNARSRRVYRCQVSQFVAPLTRTTRLLSGFNWSSFPWKRGESSRRFGVVLDHYYYRDPSGASIYSADCWTTADLSACESVRLLVSKVYNTPYLAGMPMKLVYKRTRTLEPDVGLETISVARRAIADTEFQLPAGYKSVDSADKIFSSTCGEEGLHWMIK